ncbi:hypothetical protein [Acanthopleuribacter pedis]|uniref:Uncharacterized protein n=1 Tax=Acanthopleuribacter pedis TaxID=442870 RepID=A0A8J7QES9_9BACT|nr:hypothetical protein [Acanthopleuribacter pedis]MBO1321450.1 hypothetical protein [Acanthopleuribacter pedis]
MSAIGFFQKFFFAPSVQKPQPHSADVFPSAHRSHLLLLQERSERPGTRPFTSQTTAGAGADRVTELRDQIGTQPKSQLLAEIDREFGMTPEEKGLARAGMDLNAVLDVVVDRLEGAAATR